MLEVVTVFAPRADYPKWREFLPLLDLQRRTAEKFKHRHVVVSDTQLDGMDTLKVDLPESLMHLLLTAQLEYLKQWSNEHPVVIVDVDCLVARNLEGAFTGRFDMGFTSRDNPAAPINNGAMYFAAGSRKVAVKLFEKALTLCGAHWGGDQEALAQVLAPVMMPMRQIRPRLGARVEFFSMRTHNCVPRVEAQEHRPTPFIVHFKGDRKGWMKTYAERFILWRQ